MACRGKGREREMKGEYYQYYYHDYYCCY